MCFARLASRVIPFIFLISGCSIPASYLPAADLPPLDLPIGPAWLNLPNPDEVELVDFYYPPDEIDEPLTRMHEAAGEKHYTHANHILATFPQSSDLRDDPRHYMPRLVGEILWKTGQYEDALAHYQDSLPQIKLSMMRAYLKFARPQTDWVSAESNRVFAVKAWDSMLARINNVKLSVGGVNIDYGNWNEAYRHLRESRELAELLDDDSWRKGSGFSVHRSITYGRFMPVLSELYCESGQFEKAISATAQIRGYSDVRLRMARIYLKAEDSRRARDIFVSIIEDGLSPQSEYRIRAEIGLAVVEDLESGFEESDLAYERARRGIESRNPQFTDKLEVEQAGMYNAWGWMLLHAGDNARAIEKFDTSLEFREIVNGPAHPDYADPLRGLAEIDMLEARHADAEKQARRALKILDDALIENHPRKLSINALLTTIALLRPSEEGDEPIDIETLPEFIRMNEIAPGPMGRYYRDTQGDLARFAGYLREAGHENTADRFDSISESLILPFE